MALTTLTFPAPVRRRLPNPALDYALFEQAIALFDDGQHAEATARVFAHLFPGQPGAPAPGQPYSFAQGSSRVTVTVDDEYISVTVPLVQLPAGGGAVAAMRFLLTKIAGSGQLHQPRLHGDEVHLEFRDRLNRLHPYKLVEVLQRMPIEADNNDDWLIGQFGALPLAREPLGELTEEEFQSAASLWREHWDAVDELLKESQRKRSVFFLNELTAFAFFRMRAALPLSGILSAKLAEHARVFNDADQDPTKRENTLAKCCKEMRAASEADLRKDLGHRTYAINPRAEGTPAVLSRSLANASYMEQIEQYRTTGKSLEAALALAGTYTFLLGRYQWPLEIETALLEGLTAASGKSWREMATVLFEHRKGVVEQFAEDEEEEDADSDEVGDDGIGDENNGADDVGPGPSGN